MAAAALSLTHLHRAAAQQTVDLFGGTFTSPTPAMLSLGGAVVNTTTATGNTVFGPGFTGNVTLGLGSTVQLSEGFSGAGNAFTIAQNGIAAVAGSTAASKTYGTSLSSGATYALTLTRTGAFNVGALGSFTLSLSQGGTQLLGSSANPGLVGLVDVLGLFGTNNTATVQFTVPTNATGALSLNINTTEPVGALGGSFRFDSAVVNQVVPEPGSVAASLLGAGALVVLRFRRRLRAR